jgi:hypothetical protein
MSTDYHNRLDFRALDVIVQAIDNASPQDLKQAITDCKEWGNYQAVPASKRHIWKQLAKILRTIK